VRRRQVDLKAFTEDFYKKVCAGGLEPVLDTLRYLVHETDVWTELTTLLIPGHNDSDDEVAALAEWVGHELGATVPLHVTAFHADYKMTDTPPTPPATLSRARDLALEAGLAHVYTGNVDDREGGTTHCTRCGTRLAGRFDGPAESWGRRRLPVTMQA
jgi:pyruvate formate lyase activating enzyme